MIEVGHKHVYQYRLCHAFFLSQNESARTRFKVCLSAKIWGSDNGRHDHKLKLLRKALWLKLDPFLCRHPVVIVVLQFLHFRYQVGHLDQGRWGIAAGENQMKPGRFLFQNL